MQEKLYQAFGNLADSFVAAAPKVAVGILLVILGFAAAKVIVVVLRYLLTRVRFDRLMEQAGIDRALQRIGLRQQLNLFIPRLVYFLVLFVLAKTVADALGLIAISSAIGAFFAYLPNIIAALLLMILGTSLGQFAGEMIAQSAQNSGIDFARSLGKLASGLIIFVVSMMAVAQLKIDGFRPDRHQLYSGRSGAGFWDFFGFGTREVIQNVTAGFYLRKFLKVGRTLEIVGQKGVLKEINATHSTMEAEDGEISVSNATFLQHVAKQ